LNGSKREKEILLETEAPPTGGAILMFFVLLAYAARSPRPNLRLLLKSSR